MELKSLPHSAYQITLEQWVNWNNVYGKQLLRAGRAKHKSEDEQLLFKTDFYAKHYAFYSNTPLEEVEAAIYAKENSLCAEVLKESATSQAALFRELCDIDNIDFINAVFEYDGVNLKIVPPVQLSPDSKVTVAQFEHIQDIALIFSDFQDDKYEALYELCAEYLQPAESHQAIVRAFNWSKEDKIQWMKLLPLYIAFCVKRYVMNSIEVYKSILNDRATNTS